jgi:hypothetical protein
MKCETSCENWSKAIKFSVARQMKFIKCERITFKVHCGNFVSIKLLVGFETKAGLEWWMAVERFVKSFSRRGHVGSLNVRFVEV